MTLFKFSSQMSLGVGPPSLHLESDLRTGDLSTSAVYKEALLNPKEPRVIQDLTNLPGKAVQTFPASELIGCCGWARENHFQFNSRQQKQIYSPLAAEAAV